MLTSTALTIQREEFPALSFPALRIKPGERTLLLGPSGSGKTTLLSMLTGLLPPTTGTVTAEGRNLYALSTTARDQLRRHFFGYVFQSLHLLPTLTLQQNIALAATMADRPVDQERVTALLQTLDLTDKAGRKPAALSQGEQQRAAIARAVLLRPSVIVADEPTSSLDDGNARKVIELLENQALQTGAALLIATHDKRIIDRFSTIINLTPQLQEAA
jgi:putative ABC transport system ATP-binding protein